MKFMTAATVRNLPEYLEQDRRRALMATENKDKEKVEQIKKVAADLSYETLTFLSSVPDEQKADESFMRKGASDILAKYKGRPGFSVEAVELSNNLVKAVLSDSRASKLFDAQMIQTNAATGQIQRQQGIQAELDNRYNIEQGVPKGIGSIDFLDPAKRTPLSRGAQEELNRTKAASTLAALKASETQANIDYKKAQTNNIGQKSTKEEKDQYDRNAASLAQQLRIPKDLQTGAYEVKGLSADEAQKMYELANRAGVGIGTLDGKPVREHFWSSKTKTYDLQLLPYGAKELFERAPGAQKPSEQKPIDNATAEKLINDALNGGSNADPGSRVLPSQQPGKDFSNVQASLLELQNAVKNNVQRYGNNEATQVNPINSGSLVPPAQQAQQAQPKSILEQAAARQTPISANPNTVSKPIDESTRPISALDLADKGSSSLNMILKNKSSDAYFKKSTDFVFNLTNNNGKLDLNNPTTVRILQNAQTKSPSEQKQITAILTKLVQSGAQALSYTEIKVLKDTAGTSYDTES